MRVRIIVAIVALAVVGVAVWWWQSGQTFTPPAQVAPVVETPPAPVEDTGVPATPEVQRVVLPPLDTSDDYVREEVSALSPQMSDVVAAGGSDPPLRGGDRQCTAG